MRDWAKALEHFGTLQNEFSQSECTKEELKKAADRIEECRHGKYDIRRLYEDSLKKGVRRFDIADYTGPVEVVDIPGKGWFVRMQ